MAWRLPLHFSAMEGDKRIFEQEKGWILLGETLEKKGHQKKTDSTIVCHKESHRELGLLIGKDNFMVISVFIVKQGD